MFRQVNTDIGVSRIKKVFAQKSWQTISEGKTADMQGFTLQNLPK